MSYLEDPVRAGVVVEVFTRVAPVWTLTAGGRSVDTTREHPVWVAGKGWRCAVEVVPGDLFLSSGGRFVECDGSADAGRVADVFNLEVEGDHTYFVGDVAWGFDVWAHNAQYEAAHRGNGRYAVRNKDTGHWVPRENGKPKLYSKAEADEAADNFTRRSSGAAAPTKPGSNATKGAAHIESHGTRPGSAWPKLTGNQAAKNAHSQELIDEIVTNPGSRTNPRLNHPRYGDIIEVIAPDGRGLRFDMKGNFIGVMEPPVL